MTHVGRASRPAFAVVSLLLVALVVVAASIGPDSVLGGGAGMSQPSPASESASGGQLDASGTLRAASPSAGAGSPTGWSHTVTLIFEILLAIGLGWLAWRVALRRRARADAATRSYESPGAPTSSEIGDRDDLRSDSDAPRSSDAAAETARTSVVVPRNAIVDCWHDLEVAAAEVGEAHRRWQTPSEFADVVLQRSGAGAVCDLADLYREARFSDHPVRETDLALAREALAAVRDSLAAAAAHGPCS